MNILRIVYDAYKSSDAIGQGIVDVLFGGSMAVWVIIVIKCIQCVNVRRACKSLMQEVDALRGVQHRILGELERDMQKQGPLAAMGRAATKALLDILRPTAQDRYAILNTGVLPRALSSEEIERIQVAIDTEINQQQRELEKRLTIMGSIITLAPMLGLLGTVWGVMATFIGIVNNGGRPDIQAIAPGISGALLTTVFGLVISIPAIFVNNIVAASIQETDKDMEDFQSLLLSSLQLAKVNAKSEESALPPAPQKPIYQESAPAPQPQPTVASAVYQAPVQAQQPSCQPQAQAPRQFYSAPGVSGQAVPSYQAPVVSSQPASYSQVSTVQQLSVNPSSSQVNYQSPDMGSNQNR